MTIVTVEPVALLWCFSLVEMTAASTRLEQSAVVVIDEISAHNLVAANVNSLTCVLDVCCCSDYGN